MRQRCKNTYAKKGFTATWELERVTEAAGRPESAVSAQLLF
jgi:hypothetical protein